MTDKAHSTYLDSFGDLDLEREAERCPLRSPDLREAERSLPERCDSDLERDFERLRSLRDIFIAHQKMVVHGFSYISY